MTPKVCWLSVLDSVDDPRIDRTKLYSLPEILLIFFCGSICGVESWEDFVEFGQSKLLFLRRFLPYENGIPSKNTFHRVAMALNPTEFRDCFIQWVDIVSNGPDNIIAVDGKTLRKSGDKSISKNPIHMVSAYATDTKLVLAQEKVDEKSNEITAIPKLLKLVDLSSSIVTIDAMGCQTDIAKQIVGQSGDYLLAVKGNQGILHNDICKHFANLFDMRHHKKVDFFEKEEKNKGRKEIRRCLVTQDLSFLSVADRWEGLKSVIAVEKISIVNGERATECRYYISSREACAETFNQIIRSHWSIENNLHWTLDVVFNEDSSRVRKGNAPENMAIIKHAALNQLQLAKPQFKKSQSIKGLRKKAGWDDETLYKIITATAG